jgi:amino acid transporter
MTFTIVFLTVIIALIVSKTRAIVLRNNLDDLSEKRLLITGGLLILFLITNVTLPYPESLYWFIGLGIVFTGIILSFNVLKKEYKRFLSLSTKSKIVNVLFYSLLIVVTNIYL